MYVQTLPTDHLAQAASSESSSGPARVTRTASKAGLFIGQRGDKIFLLWIYFWPSGKAVLFGTMNVSKKAANMATSGVTGGKAVNLCFLSNIPNYSPDNSP